MDNDEKKNKDGQKNNEEKKNKGFENIFEAFAFIPQVALSLAIPIFLGALAGNWIDDKMGTESIFLILLVLLGIAGGVVSAVHLFQIIANKKNK